MSVQIISDEENKYACMFCNTSDWAFGPVLLRWHERNAREFMEKFVAWLPQDPRTYGDDALEEKWCEFVNQECPQ